MSQQQNHNTNDEYPFGWQLDPVYWLLSHEAAPFEPAQHPGGEYFHPDLPPFDLMWPWPMGPVWNPPCMTLGHYCPPQPRRIIMDAPIFPCAGPVPGTYLEPIACYGPPFEEGPPEAMIGFHGLFLPPSQQPAQEFFSPGGPLAPCHPFMPVPFWQPPPPPPPSPFYPPWHSEDMVPGPPRQPRWFREVPNTASAPHVMDWLITCCHCPCDPESPVTPGALTAPLPSERPQEAEYGTSRVVGPGGREARRRRHSWSY